jgi:hypothetical protein
MNNGENAGTQLRGRFHDVLREAGGRVIWDRGWQNNAIVTDFRRLLAGFVHGAPTLTQGLLGLRVGAGLPAWDATGTPQATSDQPDLVDPKPHLVPRDQLQLDFVDPQTGVASARPTRSLQIRAVLGPGVPPWPESPPGPHTTSTLREFGLVGMLNGDVVLLNYRTHAAIGKDPGSTLDRTIWLDF